MLSAKLGFSKFKNLLGFERELHPHTECIFEIDEESVSPKAFNSLNQSNHLREVFDYIDDQLLDIGGQIARKAVLKNGKPVYLFVPPTYSGFWYISRQDELRELPNKSCSASMTIFSHGRELWRKHYDMNLFDVAGFMIHFQQFSTKVEGV